ncbi:MAG TPA: pitrilysin family protein [Thermoanaerobaculia bacterium]|nr:pitrilysin family protein [Thermoanaerobaculia bacterium]
MIDRTQAPLPGSPRPYHFPHVTRATLDNGLRVLVAQNHNAPLVSMRALIRSGADHDAPQVAGLASIVADLLDEGAGSRDGIRLAEDIGLLGGTLGTGADWDASYISLDLLARYAHEAFEIFSDIASRATLPPDGLERVRAERLNDLLQQRDEPAAIAAKRFSGLLYGKGPYGVPMIGTTETIPAIALDDVRRAYREHYIPNNTSVVVSGDVDPERALKLVEETLGGWQRGAETPRPSVSAQALEANRVYLIDRPTAVQSEIRIGHAGVSRASADYFPLSVMNALLGGIFNSRINLNLRERHGYTYGARSVFAFRRSAGPFVVAAPVRNEVTTESVQEVLAELRRIRTGDVEDRELNDTKSYLMGVFPATVQSASDIAGRLLDIELYGLPENYFDHYRESIGGVTKEDVERVAKKYIDPDRALIVIVGNAKQVREPLGALGYPIQELDIDGNTIA